MAKNRPAFQFYPSDFLGGVTLLSDAHCGIYMKLLATLWIQGNAIPYCMETLARAALTTPEALREAWPQLEEKFIIEDGVVSHARFSAVMQLSEVRSIAGRTGGKANPKQNAKQTGKQTDKQNLSKQSSKVIATCQKTEDRSTKDEDRRSNPEEDWEIPKKLDSPEVRKALDEFEQMRRSIGKPIKSRRNSSRVLKQFSDQEHLLYAIDFAIGNEYQGLKADYRPPGKSSAKSVGERSMEQKLRF